MTNNTIAIDGDNTGALVLWEPGPCKMTDMLVALTSIGRDKLLPKSSVAKAALKKAFHGFVSASPLYIRGNIPEINPLASHVLGFEARRMNRGETTNDPEFLLSVVVDEGGKVKVAEFNPALCPWAGTKSDKIEAHIQAKFDELTEFYPTDMASRTVARVIQSLGGISLVKKTGGKFFLPPDGVDQFESFAAVLDGAEVAPRLVTYKFQIKPTERSFKVVLQAVQEEATERLKAVEESLQDIGKMKANGKESRLAECMAVRELMERYESVLGVSLQKFKDMAEQVAGAVDAHSVLEFAA